MTKTQLDNLISFLLLFKTMDYKEQSPDYIREKWDKYIGIPITNIKSKSQASILWEEKWKTDDIISCVIDILHDNDSISFNKDTPSDMLDRFGKIFDVLFINNEFYNGLHAVLKSELNIWIKGNQRDYNLCLLT